MRDFCGKALGLAAAIIVLPLLLLGVSFALAFGFLK